VKQDLGYDSCDEMRIKTIGVQGNNSFHASSSSTSKSQDNERRRSELFRIIFVSKHPENILYLIRVLKLT
jgi:hypothetical protein